MKSLAELVLSFLFFWVLPDGFCGVPCELPPEYPPILLGLLPSLIAAASCGAPEIAAARMTAVASKFCAWFLRFWLARTSVRLVLNSYPGVSLFYEFIPRTRFPVAMRLFQAANTENLAFLPPTVP